MEFARLREGGGCSLSNNWDLRLSIRQERLEAETESFHTERWSRYCALIVKIMMWLRQLPYTCLYDLAKSYIIRRACVISGVHN